MTSTLMIEQGGKIIARALGCDATRLRGDLIDILMDETEWPLATCHGIYSQIRKAQLPKAFVSMFGETFTYGWEITSSEKFYQMLECLPPRTQTLLGFLVGEAWVHKACNVANEPGQVVAGYQAFVHKDGLHYVCTMPLTVKEFRATKPSDIIEFLRV